MCTSIISNRKKTIVGFNLDILDMEYRVRKDDYKGVYIEINDKTEGFMPLFGANSRGDFVGMPTCWPYDKRSDPTSGGENIIMLDIDFLLQHKNLSQIHAYVEKHQVFSVPGLTFMGSLSDSKGNVLHIIPGQGYRYYEKPKYKVLTNFSPIKGYKEKHPWMGIDRYEIATRMLESATDDFDVENCFDILRNVSQTVCPTVVSMVYDVKEKAVYWCEHQKWEDINFHKFKK